MLLNIEKSKKIYMVGIKGAGMVGLAEIFLSMGKEVVGSDTEEKFFSDEILKAKGIKFYEGFSRGNVEKEEEGIDLLVYSTAYDLGLNPELRYAFSKNILCVSYPEAIGALMNSKYGIAVCGTHGKTTVTAMLALAMKDVGADPTALVGSKVKQLDSNALAGKSQYFVVEADEYQNKFKHYSPLGAILTSADYDHPDYYKSFEDYKKAFKDFVGKIPRHGFLVAWGESVDTLEIAKEAKCRIIFYGFFKDERQIEEIKKEFDAVGRNNLEFYRTPINLYLKVPGKHNLLNATAVLAAAKQLKLDEKKIKESVSNYEGVVRRFEELGTYNKAVVIDDYAHHPEEIKATLKAAREKYPEKNVICVFHPHTFTRTKALLDSFSQSFDNADEVIVIDIYGSAREKQGGVSSADLVEKMRAFRQEAVYIPTIEEAFEYLKDKLTYRDLLITMGAGNVNELGKKLVKIEP